MSEGGGTRKVCLICGIRTTQLVNIFEERSGPNLVDVIFEKYNFRAEHDTDKFLCYSCNNWLINWWSLQNKADQANNQPHSSSNSPSKSERNRNEQRRYTGKTDKENGQRRAAAPFLVDPGPERRPPLTELNTQVASLSAHIDNCTAATTMQLSDGFNDKIQIQKDVVGVRKRSNRLRHRWREITPHQKLPAMLDMKIVEMLQKQGTQICLENDKHFLMQPPNLVQSDIEPKLLNATNTNLNHTKDQEEILLAFDSSITEAIFKDNFISTLTRFEVNELSGSHVET